MNPTLWGPAMWRMLFACAWHCDRERFPQLETLVMVQVPLLLPCDKCRRHFLTRRVTVNRRARGVPTTPEHMFRWLYHLKDLINRELHIRSLTLDELTQRYVLHAGRVDDVDLADTLVLVAIDAVAQGQDGVFRDLCHTLGELLPLPSDSQLLVGLRNFEARGSIVRGAMRMCRAARVEHGLAVPVLKHFQALAAA